MNLALKKTTCRALVISLLALSFQSARAGMIGTEQATAESAPSERTLLLNSLDRSEVATQLQAAGVDPVAARERVRSMTDQEVHAMAQDIQTAPAGGVSTWGWVAIVVVIGLIWYYAVRK
ncbi:PA2779 family protein [Ramlibacter sp. G-1-2-2]|uniref:PA2779 family protein n=1 Tax=Ramlibacter agri TaxID=2728837 RepID=A0A848H612_9BURK|nr:PA2779 family protein [Ramlibacter agri]NML44961.1 PA2779 family protein [Ramlibacter agri]